MQNKNNHKRKRRKDMLFNSSQFLLFFPIVVLCYFIIPKKARYLWLLAASYYFYMCWNATYALLILASTIITYASGLLLEWCKNQNLPDVKKQKRKKLCVAVSFILNLGILVYFKYTNFLIDTLNELFSAISIDLNISSLDILLPVGISFYTFQALSYTMDVYRDEIYAEKNFFRYALFVSFFPQLVAGPIERSGNLLKQLAAPTKLLFVNVRDGVLLMLWGYFLKIVIADRAAIYVDTIYGNHTEYPGMYLLLAAFLFSIQIYCDFYGYSVIAMGAARVLGYQLMDNFNAPFLSCSVAELWNRWHISLSSWFKDYLYIPLGGNRKGRLRKNINKIIVFLISGLWHGANWTYVVWGGLNGLYQVIGDLFMPVRDRFVSFFHINRKTFSHRLYQTLFTFCLFTFSFIFFRASSMEQAWEVINSIFTLNNPTILFDGSLYLCGLDSGNFTLLFLAILVLLVADICKYQGIYLQKVIARQSIAFQSLVVVSAVLFVLLFGIWGSGYNESNFIYFQF